MSNLNLDELRQLDIVFREIANLVARLKREFTKFMPDYDINENFNQNLIRKAMTLLEEDGGLMKLDDGDKLHLDKLWQDYQKEGAVPRDIQVTIDNMRYYIANLLNNSEDAGYRVKRYDGFDE